MVEENHQGVWDGHWAAVLTLSSSLTHSDSSFGSVMATYMEQIHSPQFIWIINLGIFMIMYTWIKVGPYINQGKD